MRINARLDDVRSRKLAYLERETGWSVSRIVRTAIDTYYRALRRAKADPASALKNSGFVGCAEGPSDLSVAYKNELRSLSVKHGHR
jgi:hypothetical protein